jgi:hypothetical protein
MRPRELLRYLAQRELSNCQDELRRVEISMRQQGGPAAQTGWPNGPKTWREAEQNAWDRVKDVERAIDFCDGVTRE